MRLTIVLDNEEHALWLAEAKRADMNLSRFVRLAVRTTIIENDKAHQRESSMIIIKEKKIEDSHDPSKEKAEEEENMIIMEEKKVDHSHPIAIPKPTSVSQAISQRKTKESAHSDHGDWDGPQ